MGRLFLSRDGVRLVGKMEAAEHRAIQGDNLLAAFTQEAASKPFFFSFFIEINKNMIVQN